MRVFCYLISMAPCCGVPHCFFHPIIVSSKVCLAVDALVEGILRTKPLLQQLPERLLTPPTSPADICPPNGGLTELPAEVHAALGRSEGPRAVVQEVEGAQEPKFSSFAAWMDASRAAAGPKSRHSVAAPAEAAAEGTPGAAAGGAQLTPGRGDTGEATLSAWALGQSPTLAKQMPLPQAAKQSPPPAMPPSAFATAAVVSQAEPQEQPAVSGQARSVVTGQAAQEALDTAQASPTVAKQAAAAPPLDAAPAEAEPVHTQAEPSSAPEHAAASPQQQQETSATAEQQQQQPSPAHQQDIPSPVVQQGRPAPAEQQEMPSTAPPQQQAPKEAPEQRRSASAATGGSSSSSSSGSSSDSGSTTSSSSSSDADSAGRTPRDATDASDRDVSSDSQGRRAGVKRRAAQPSPAARSPKRRKDSPKAGAACPSCACRAASCTPCHISACTYPGLGLCHMPIVS